MRSPQLGRVILEDEVDVGANTTIDRARIEETRIGEGTKIDNLVQIGHNVTIGKHCFLVAFVNCREHEDRRLRSCGRTSGHRRASQCWQSRHDWRAIGH